MSGHDPVLRQHGYHSLRIARVVPETHDASSFVLDVPEDLAETFLYRPGQFCTFRVHVDGDVILFAIDHAIDDIGRHLRNFAGIGAEIS